MKEKQIALLFFLRDGIFLFSQAVSSQVSSTLMSLTTVFGMGTGGSSSPLTPSISFEGSVPSKLNKYHDFRTYHWSSPRPISTRQLNASRRLHFEPINLVVYKGSYLVNPVGYLILRTASRLDAFSVYPIRTQLPCRAIGMTTGTPEVRPSRSSRTRDSSHQISCAHDRQGPNCLTTF